MENQKLMTKLENCLQQLGLTHKIQRQSGDQRITFSALLNSDGIEVSAGSGNGNLSIEKSIAECIEHFFFLNSKSYFESKAVKEITQQNGFSKDRILKGLDEDQIISVAAFEQLDESRSGHWVPLDYISRQSTQNSVPLLKKLCSSSGYSFHQTRKNALLHGILEVIERDDFSRVLLGQQPAYRVPYCSMPESLQVEISFLAEEFKGDICVFAIESRFKVWTTFIIFFPKTDYFLIPQTSQKTSLNFASSIQGALSEMRQILCLYSEEERQEDLSVLGDPRLKDHPCIQLEHFRNLSQQIKYLTLDNSPEERASQGDLAFIIESLTQRGFHPLGRTVYEFENGCHVTQVFVPGFEKYNLIRLGVEVPTHQKV